MEKIPLRQVILCEGKYDVIRLSSLFDALILPTHGFQIYNDRQRRELLRRLAAQRGLIVATDSDSAGFQIRGYLKRFIPVEQLRHVYIPDVAGRERRKSEDSGEGKLGVEGMETGALLEAFERAGVLDEQAAPPPTVSKIVLYQDGFSGKPGAKARYKALLRQLELPEHLSVNHFCACVGVEEYERAKEEVRMVI